MGKGKRENGSGGIATSTGPADSNTVRKEQKEMKRGPRTEHCSS